MFIRRHSLTLVFWTVVALGAFPWMALGQSPPQPLPLDLVGQSQLTPEQEKRVSDYVAYHAVRLTAETATPTEVERARDELIRPLNQPNAASLIKPAFRGAYARAVVPEMETAISGGGVFRSANAMIVLAQVGTDRAANALLQHIDAQSQSQWQLRLRAADSLRMMMQGGTLDARKIVEAARRLLEAAEREEDGRVLNRQLSALHTADSVVQQPGDHQVIRALIGEAVKAACKRMTSQPELQRELMDAVGLALVRLRERFVEYSREEKASIGAQIGSTLHEVLTYAQSHWDKAQSDPVLTRPMTVIVASSEVLLQFIDPVLNTGRAPPSSDMNNAWKAKDKPKYEQGLSNWQSVVSKAPYKP